MRQEGKKKKNRVQRDQVSEKTSGNSQLEMLSKGESIGSETICWLTSVHTRWHSVASVGGCSIIIISIIAPKISVNSSMREKYLAYRKATTAATAAEIPTTTGDASPNYWHHQHQHTHTQTNVRKLIIEKICRSPAKRCVQHTHTHTLRENDSHKLQITELVLVPPPLPLLLPFSPAPVKERCQSSDCSVCLLVVVSALTVSIIQCFGYWEC